MMQEAKESGRIRKPSSKYENEIVADDSADQAIKAFQKEFKKKKKHSTVPNSSSAEPPRSILPATTTRKYKVHHETKKAKHVPVPTLTSKEKALNDAEERLINAALEKKAKASEAIRTLPEGAIEVADLQAAVKRAVRESCSLLLDWTTKEAMMIGSMCKVYWDGEHQWFYARILNYDSKYDRHYIYYYEDSTAEWISLQNESVLIGDRLVLAKATPNSIGWPSLHYWASPLAVPRQKLFKGYIKGATYCEYYYESGLMDWGFMLPERIQPIQEEFMPKKMTKKYEAALHKAQEEQETTDSVLETVLKAVRDNVYNALSGEQWIGMRVRASTHFVFADSMELASNSSSSISDGRHYGRRHANGGSSDAATKAMCTGTVTHYCGVTNQYFVVFDDEGLQPQWVVAQKGVMDVLIGPGEALPASAASEIALRANKGPTDCALCGLSVLNEDGTPLPDVKHCDCCPLVCHGYCAPQFSMYDSDLDSRWTCWNCNSCFGCGATSMMTELMSWNGKRTEPELGDDRIIMLCGHCMYRYKHVKDFCSICLKLYATDDSMLPYQQPPPLPGAQSNGTHASAVAPAAAEVVCVEVTAPAKKPHWKTRQKKNANDAQVVPEAVEKVEGEVNDACANPVAMEVAPEETVAAENVAPVSEVAPGTEEKLESSSEATVLETVTEPIVEPVAVAVDSAIQDASPVESSELPVTSGSSSEGAEVAPQLPELPAVEEENMVQCNECTRWVHAECEGIDQTQYDAMTLGTHPVWGDEYLCPLCRIKLGQLIIDTLQREDTISMFANPVTTAVAKNYFDVIGNPMDLSKMKSKCAKGQYKSLQTLRQDFELMCLNAIVFNQAGDEYWQHARMFHEKVQHQFNTQARLSHISANGFELNQLIEQYNIKAAAEAKVEQNGAKGKRKSKGGAGADTNDGTDKRIKMEPGVNGSAVSTGSGGEASTSQSGADETESARLAALLSSSMLPSAMVAVTANDEMDAIDKENEANKLMSALDIILPTTCVPCPDPQSFMACAVMVQSSEEAFYTCCMDTCLLCGSAGSSAMFLFCVDCGEAAHSFCADAPLTTMSEAVRLSWRCMNCKICEKCGSATEAEESSLIYCERCDRAYHIGCLNPCMPSVPQSRWFCNECVDCKTCKAKATVSEGVNHPSSWGFEFDKCQFCTNEENREAERIAQAKNEAHALRMAELMKRQRQLILNVYLCNICEVDCSDNFLVCRNCGQNSHPHCSPSVSSYWTKDRAPMDFMCEHCLVRMEDQPSHLGTGPLASKLLSAVASIQRNRWFQSSRISQHKKAVTHNVIMEHLSANRYLLLAVVQWAVMRATRLEKDNVALDIAVCKSRDTPDLNLHYWVRMRATRFYCLWRRIGNRTRAEWLAFRSNLTRGYDAKGIPLDSGTLSRYATMASAFLCATAAELITPRIVLELTPVANELIARFPTRKAHPEYESNPLNAAYMKIMTQVYDESGSQGAAAPAAAVVKTEGEVAIKTEGSASNGSASGVPAVIPRTDEDSVGSRVMDLINLIKDVQSHLMCGPIGLSGSCPESFNASQPLNIRRTNVNVAGAVEVSCNLVGEDYWNLKISNTGASSSSSGGAATDDQAKAEEDPKEASRGGDRAGPVFNPALGFPSTILDNLKCTNALPGNLIRSNLLYNGNRVSSNGLFSPASPNASSSTSNEGASAAFYGRAVSSTTSGASTANKRKGLRGGPPASSSEATEVVITQSVTDLTTPEPSGSSKAMAKAARVNFAAAMGKHLDSVVSVSLYAGDNYFAKKARLQRLTALDEAQQTINEQVQFLSAADLEIHLAAESAREKRAKLYFDAQLQKEAEERRLIEEEEQRKRAMIAAAVEAASRMKAMHEASVKTVTEPNPPQQTENQETSAATDLAESEVEAPVVEEQPPATEEVGTAKMETDETEVEAEIKPSPVVESDQPVPESSETNGTTTHSSGDSVSAEASEGPSDMKECEEEGGVSVAMDCDAVSVAAVSVIETKSQKDVSVTTGSVVGSNNGTSKRRSNNGSDAPAAPAVKRTRTATILMKNFVTEKAATEKSTEVLPDIMSQCGVLVPPPTFSYPYCMEVGTTREDQSLRCSQTLPLRGWSDLQLPKQPWQDPRSCHLCHVSTEDHFLGRLLAFSDGHYAHANCLRWSSDVTERGGVLYDCDKAMDRSVVATCHYCHLKGATVSCMNRRKCGRIYHLKCAAMVNCVFLECKGSKDISEQTEFDVHSVILCAEHAGFVMERSDRVFRKWLPMDPNRRLLLEDNLDTTVPEVSEMMSMKRGNKIVRSGALSILSIGEPRLDLPDFHTTQYIYPYHFKSARIFWSMFTPLQRTMYVFEIFSEVDFEAMPRSQSDYVMSSLDYYKEQGGDLYDHGSSNSPVFRIISLDNAQRPMYIKSIQQAYDLIQSAVEECNEAHRSTFRKRLSLDAYGLNAHQFFGLGQSFVRRAIELIPESTAAMVALPPHAHYAPSFKLPTEADARRIHRLQLAAKMTGAMSVNGCVRADGYVPGATRPMGVRITKMLTKVATDHESSDSGGARSKQADPDEEPPTFAVDEEREENRREIEYNRTRYLEMSAAYLKDPNAKLEVQKSRIHGWGLFARINFERNDIIVEYIGEKVRAVIADKREAMYEDEGVGSCYLFRLDKDDIVDATKTGGMARFMNHCCEPNAYARIISSNDPGPGVPENKHIVIIAGRDIQEGEEITYDYKFPIEEKKLKCYCGALKCQGSMN